MNLHPLQVAANTLAATRNAEVVIAALSAHGECRGCQYGENKEIFPSTLQTYIIWKIRHSRLTRGTGYVYFQYGELGAHENVYLNLIKAKEKLDSMWPCENCIQRFNPTHRTRRRYGNRRRGR